MIVSDSSKIPLKIRLLLAGALFGCCLSCGCRTAPQIGVTDTGAPRYDRAMLVYELNGAERPLPLTEAEITPVSFEAETARADRPPLGWASAQLSIQYPHPDGSEDMARATLRLSSQPGRPDGKGIEGGDRLFGFDLLSSRGLAGDAPSDAAKTSGHKPDDEIWVLDFPKQQLDLLLVDLASNGFFAAQLRNDVGTHLDVQIDRGRTQKPWTPEPRLDHFVARVYREGRLGGFVPCHAPKS